jgi:hypothetical protein
MLVKAMLPAYDRGESSAIALAEWCKCNSFLNCGENSFDLDNWQVYAISERLSR